MSIRRRLRGRALSLAASISLLVLPLVSTRAHAATIGVLSGFSYSFTGGSSPFVSQGATSTIPDQGFSSPGAGDGAFGGVAMADFLALRTGGHVSGTANHVCQCIQIGAEVDLFAVSQDILHPAAGATTMSITLSVSGTNSGIGPTSPGTLLTDARTVLNVVGFDPASAIDVDTTGPVVGRTFFRQQAYRAVMVNQQLILTLPVTSASGVGLWIELISVAQGSAVAGSFQAITDFTSTVQITGIQLFDASGQPLANPTLTADSGTLYPLLGVAEPHAAWLLGAAGLAYAMRRRLRASGC